MGYNKLTSLSANIKAIETAVAIHSQGRTATQEEKQVLAQYSGFGGIKDVLDLGTDKPLDKGVAGLLNRLLDALRTLAGGDEAACRSLVESIKSSVLTAFYTPQFLIDAVAAQIHKTFSANGLQMQSFLEPSAGIGGFLPDVLSVWNGSGGQVYPPQAVWEYSLSSRVSCFPRRY